MLLKIKKIKIVKENGNKRGLYNLSEKQVIEKIEKCEYHNISKCFNIWKNATYVNESDELVKDKYCVSVKQKMRYINPLVRSDNKFVRIDKISNIAKEEINKYLNFTTKKYAYLDFNF